MERTQQRRYQRFLRTLKQLERAVVRSDLEVMRIKIDFELERLRTLGHSSSSNITDEAGKAWDADADSIGRVLCSHELSSDLEA